jgi:hypothetical protein
VSYQVLARKWRPQRFEDVVGQQAVTTTLRNALSSGRIAQAFIFAGARGVGKTTTARILARALNCVKGPTPIRVACAMPCVEIAQGRDMDVLEIDAATHTGIDNIREVIVSTLSMSPVRDRYKVFVIDEVHQLSSQSFNALLKSVEEPPPHVVFIMATTELHKIPGDHPLALAGVRVPDHQHDGDCRPASHHRAAEGIHADEDAIALVARYAEGSMRDAQSALDQVIAFAGQKVTSDDVATVLGLVGRDLLFDIVTAVADEDAGGRVCTGRPRRGRRIRPAHPVPRAGGDGARDDARVNRSGTCERRGAGARGRSRSPRRADGPFLTGGPAAIVRRAGQGGAGRPRRLAAALRAGNGAGEVDPPAQAVPIADLIAGVGTQVHRVREGARVRGVRKVRKVRRRAPAHLPLDLPRRRLRTFCTCRT